MDLHRNNVVCGLVDQEGRRLVEKRLPCELETIVHWLEPYRTRLQRLAIESTYNWYWLVDGLQEAGFDVVLANPARIEQYSGLKHADDRSDAYFLAELLRLNILPTGHIYDRQLRPVRDLLRRRLLLVRQAAALKLSFKSLYARTTGQTLSLSRLQQLTPAEVRGLFAHGAEPLIAQEQLRLIGEMGQSIAQIELAVGREVQDWTSYRWVQTIPGVGKILGLTIALETGPIARFASAGDYASYCRCVRSERVSNGKVKGGQQREERQPVSGLGLGRGRAVRATLLRAVSALLRPEGGGGQRGVGEQGAGLQAGQGGLARDAGGSAVRLEPSVSGGRAGG